MITKGTSVGAYLDGVINETLKQDLHQRALDEKDKQVSFAPKDKSDDELDGSDNSGKGEEPTDFDTIHNDNEKSKTMSNDADAMKGDVKLDDVVEKLNTIRSGKSFKDSLVTQRFEEYFSSLSDAEKVAMFSFFKGVAQIVTGETEPEQAAQPSDKPADVKMQKGPEKQQKQVKPNVIKTPDKSPGNTVEKPKPTAGEDTSPPINVKKRG